MLTWCKQLHHFRILCFLLSCLLNNIHFSCKYLFNASDYLNYVYPLLFLFRKACFWRYILFLVIIFCSVNTLIYFVPQEWLHAWFYYVSPRASESYFWLVVWKPVCLYLCEIISQMCLCCVTVSPLWHCIWRTIIWNII